MIAVAGQAEREAQDLSWLADALGWEIATPGSERRGRQEAPTAGERSFWVLPDPSGAGVRQLVPIVPGGGRVLEAFNDSMSVAARLRRAATGRALGLGAGRLLRLRTVTFRVGAGGSVPDGSSSLLAFLGRAVGRPVEVGVALGNELRPNRKPVLQLLDASRRRMAGYAKIGWNEHTNALVDAEAGALAHIDALFLSGGPSEPVPLTREGNAGSRRQGIYLPEMLHHGRWEGRSVLVTSPGPRPFLQRRESLPPEADIEVASSLSGGVHVAGFGGSPYVAGLRTRLTRLATDEAAGEAASGALQAFDALVAETGPLSVPFGAWHGDWTPWNMIRPRRHGPAFVWDWERYGGPVPVGFDRLHFGFQVAWGAGRVPVTEALRGAEGAAREVAGPLGIDPATVPILARWYLLEQVARFEEGRAAGMRAPGSFVPEALAIVTAGARA